MTDAIVEYFHCTTPDGNFWLEIVVNGNLQTLIGPFDTEAERQRAHDDMMEMMRQTGATEMPLKMQ